MPIDETLRTGAVQLLAAGYQPLDVIDGLIRLGVAADEAQACVRELAALKAAADARDPAQLRAKATWMLFHGAPHDEVVQYFETMGVAREHGVPEVDRLAIEVRSMVACERCRTPVAAASSVFDKRGARICGRCDQSDQIREYDRRAVESMEQERAQTVRMFGAVGAGIGLGLLAGRAVGATMVGPRAPGDPCRNCGSTNLTLVEALHPTVRASVRAGITYLCSDCGAARA